MVINQEYFWTDSKIVLGYLANDTKRFYMYVANRTQEIKESTDQNQWNYVRSKDNPADIASRGSNIDELKESAWFDGTSFLRNVDLQKYLSSNYVDRSIQNEDPEVRSMTTTMESRQGISDRYNNLSSWKGLVRSIALLKKMASAKQWKLFNLETSDIEEAEVTVIQTTKLTAIEQKLHACSRIWS